MNPFKKEYEKFEKKLTNILNTSSNAKTWSDLLPLTKEILAHLSKYQYLEFAKLSNRHTLSKRLAQCLNPECPGGVHEVVLDIYQLILNNIISKNEAKLMDNLGLYACGLFPFFPNASLTNKKKYLEIIVKKNFLCIDINEFILCLPGLLCSIIPGLDDNNDEMTQMIFDTLDLIKSKIKEHNFFGVYWTLILRNTHLRSSGMKYLLEKITKYIDIKKSNLKKEDIIKNYFPNINTVVINSLCSVIEEKEIPTVRMGMDFIITRFPLTKENDMINDNSKITLIISALKLLVKNEYSTTRRLNQWLLGINSPDDDVDYDSEDMQYKISLIIKALKNIFNKDKNHKQDELKDYLKVIEQLLAQQVEFIDYLLPKISYDILKCVVKFWKIELNSSENAYKNIVISKVSSFFTKDDAFNEWLWISIADNLYELSKDSESIINIINTNNDSPNNSNILNTSFSSNSSDDRNSNLNLNINFTSTTIKKTKNIYGIIDEIILSLKFTLLFIDKDIDQKRIKYYIPIITHLLNIMKKLKFQNIDNFKKMRNILLITLIFIKNLQDNHIDNNLDKKESLSSSPLGAKVNSNNTKYFFKEMSSGEGNLTRFIIKDESSLENIMSKKISKEIISNFTSSILNYQEFYINILEKYYQIDKNTEITKNEMSIFRQCTELMIRLEEYAQNEEIPKWVICLEKIIFNYKGNIKLSLEAANYILDLNLSSFNDHKIYKTIKNNFQKKEIDPSVIDQNYLDTLIKKTGVQKNCFELLMAKLYLVIKEQSCQRTIIDLLIKIATVDQIKFTNIISNTFNLNNMNNNIDSCVESVKLFSDFWKLTNEFYSDVIFFSNGECIFKMIDFLEDKNPLLRHLSKSWLNQNNRHFDKILDPLLSVLLNDYSCFKIIDNKIYFDKEYENSRIIDAFSKLKNIILNSSLMNFLKANVVSADLLIKDKIKNIQTKSSTYLSLLISITLSFTRCKCSKELNKKFDAENYSVNAASCEFLEFLLSHINNNELLISYAKEINLPILLTLDEAIENNDEVMQVQLLNVLKVLYFNSSPAHLSNKSIVLSIFQNETLIKVLIKGMTRDYFFVREHFINFTKDCLPIFRNIMGDINGIKNLFNVGQSFISALIIYLSKRINIERIGRKEFDKFSHFDPVNNKLIFKNYLEEYKEYKRYDENDVLLILKGIRDILFHFLNITNVNEYNSNNNNTNNQNFNNKLFSEVDIDKEIDDKNIQNIPIPILNKNIFNGNWIEYKQYLVSRDKTTSSFIEFISNFFDSNDFDKQEQNEEISYMPKSLYSNQIFNLLNGLLLTWINQSEKYVVYDYCLNNNGILPYKETSNWNKLSDDEILKSKKEINKQPIKMIVREIAFNLFITNPIEFIENIITLWCYKTSTNNKNNNANKVNVTIDKQYKLSIIELLISLDIPLNIILYCVSKVLQKNTKKNIYKKDPTFKCISTPYDTSLFESKLFHFLYSYILLNPNNGENIQINGNESKDYEIAEIWKEMINILNTVMYDSKIIYTHCWLYETMELTLEKYNISLINDNTDIKKKLNIIFNYLTNNLFESSFNNKFDSKYTKDNKMVLPFLPHIYSNIIDELYCENLYKKETIDNKEEENNEDLNENIDNENEQIINDFIINNKNNDQSKSIKGSVNKFYHHYCFSAKLSSEYIDADQQIIDTIELTKLNEYYRKVSFITLKENFAKIISFIYYDNLNNQKKYLTEVIKGLITLIKEKTDDFLSEFSSDFLVSLMKDCPKNTTSCGKNLFKDYLNDPSFFETKPKMIRNWRRIISSSVKYYPELLTDLINNIDNGFLFLKGNDDEKMKTLRRISFVIYSCEKDTFHSQFDVIREKAKEFLSGYNNNVLLESEIFLMMRILFLRFSHEGVMKMIKDLWPIIFMELIMNIEDEERNKKVKLVLESLKFIELLSLANIEEFTLYQWIFIMDTFDMQNLNIKNENSLLFHLMVNEKKIFRPITVNLLNMDDLNDVDDKLLEGNHKSKSELYIKIKNESVQDLHKAVKKYFYSIGDMNSYKVYVNYEQIEEVIEKDFIAEKVNVIR